MTRTGRCLCESVSYEISGDPIAVAICHCHRCQRQSGSAFSCNLVLHESQLTVTGTLATYTETGEDDDGEYVHRRFCPSCGSPIVSALLGTDGVVAVKVGTLDDTSDIAPAAEVWCEHRQSWVDLGLAISIDRE